MDKNSWYIPLLAAGLSIAFIIVSFAVYLTKGKSTYWLSKKLKIGGLLIGLTTTAVTHQSCVTCYDYNEPMPDNYFELDGMDYYNDTLDIDFSVTNKISGAVYSRYGEDLVFSVRDSLMVDTVQTGEILPLDGIFDEEKEEFEIELDSALKSSIYHLSLYDAKVPDQSYNNMYTIKVTNED
ncbi:MAG: hypothetical protein ABFS32_20455 [Bacteroidota bacterium]